MELNYVEKVRAKLLGLSGDPDLADLYTLLALVKGADASLEDVHNAWAVWRNRTNATHRSLVPFAELTVAVQELDREYMEAIHAAASRAGA